MSQINIAFCLNRKLGDSFVALLFANQLAEAGYVISIYSDVLDEVQKWLPKHFKATHPSIFNIDAVLSLSQKYDAVIFYHHPEILKVLDQAHSIHPQLSNLIYLTPKGCAERLPKNDFSKFEDPILTKLGSLSGKQYAHPKTRPYEYIENLCKIIALPIKNLIQPCVAPLELKERHRHFNKRVLIHPTASTPKHSWAPKKFIRLAEHLKNASFQPVFILQNNEIPQWNKYLEDRFEYIALPLSKLSDYIYESGFAICNESGVGHLCSFLRIPTLTINVIRSWTHQRWAPFFYPNEIVTHTKWQPRSLYTCKTHRRTLITAKKAFNSFLEFADRYK